MANKNLFSSIKSWLPRTSAVNEAGGRAYALAPKHALAQLAATGCFNGAYYATRRDSARRAQAADRPGRRQRLPGQAGRLRRERAYMKDMPAALVGCALEARHGALAPRVRPRRRQRPRPAHACSRWFARASSAARACRRRCSGRFQRWLNDASVGKLLSASIGNDPSLRDVLRMARPTPRDNARRALFGWLTDKPVEKWAPATRTTCRRGADARRLPPGGNGRSAGADRWRPVGPLGPVGRRGQGSARLEGDCPPDGSAGVADEPQHAAASRGLR